MIIEKSVQIKKKWKQDVMHSSDCHAVMHVVYWIEMDIRAVEEFMAEVLGGIVRMGYRVIRLIDRPEIKGKAAKWFHDKWGIPLEAYAQSMEECLLQRKAVPQWYVVMEAGRIIGGLGVIENDFHDRKDLAPNVCAVYVEEDMRCKGVAGTLLHYACMDMKEKGVDVLYLVTDHTSFYERYGWEFMCMVQGEGKPDMNSIYIHRRLRETGQED